MQAGNAGHSPRKRDTGRGHARSEPEGGTGLVPPGSREADDRADALLVGSGLVPVPGSARLCLGFGFGLGDEAGDPFQLGLGGVAGDVDAAECPVHLGAMHAFHIA
jgi:hypothetical protein